MKDRLIKLNEELANDPTPLENNREPKVLFKDNLVDLVAPPPDFSDDESPRTKKVNMSQEDDHSESISSNKSKPPTFKKKEIVIERDGKFEVVCADDVTASDLMMMTSPAAASAMDKNNNQSNNYDDYQRSPAPAPPSMPRPSTANGNSRRVFKPAPKARPQSANSSLLQNFSYTSPYGLSNKQKKLAEERAQILEAQRKQEELNRKNEEEEKYKENKEAFDYWLKQKRDQDKRRKDKERGEILKNEQKDQVSICLKFVFMLTITFKKLLFMIISLMVLLLGSLTKGIHSFFYY